MVPKSHVIKTMVLQPRQDRGAEEKKIRLGTNAGSSAFGDTKYKGKEKHGQAHLV